MTKRFRIPANMKEYTGLLAVRPNVTGDGFYSLYDGGKSGMDTEAGRWQTVCEKHATICSHDTRRLAYWHLDTGEWCEECQNLLLGKGV